jgi:hypothetical protein
MALSAAKANKILEDGFIRGKALTEKQKKFFGAIADGATPLKKLNGGWLDKFQNGGDVSFDSVQRAIRNVESLDGKLMWNPESTATGLYGQLFSQVKDDYSGTREEFAKDTISQKKFFKDRFFKGLPSTQTTSLVQDANDIYNEYAPQISNFNYSKEDLAVLSNFLGRQGTREYLGYHVRDNQPLEKALPNIYGSDAKQRNKTPEQYLKQARKYYKEGGWLDKFDNGGVQPNYNDSNVSLPPGFKGWGYDKGGRAYNGAWNGPVAQEGQRVADIATRWEMNEIDSGRPPLNIVEKVKSWFDPDSCVRDNTCVQTVKDIQSEAGIYAIPDDVYNNREFLKNYKKYGFTQITDEKDLQPGDILQYYSRDEKEAEKDPNYVDFPYHMGIYVNPGEYIGDGDSKAPTQRKNMYYEYDSKGNRYDKDPFRIFRYTPPKKQMGGSLPGATGMMYARTSGTSPEEPKKAQDGGAMVSQYEEPAWYEKAADYLASPMTSLGYLARGEDLPDRLPINVENRNTFDMVIDMINPAAWYAYAESADRNISEGNYTDAAFDALGAIPVVPAWLAQGKNATKVGKNVIKKAASSVDDVGKGFKSEINWGKWNKSIPENQILIQEYNLIEETAKANGTWMKNVDGSAFKGTPEQFVQIRSGNFQKAFPNALLDDAGNPLINYHGSGSKFNAFDESKFFSGEYGKGVYTSPDKEAILRSYANPSKNRTKVIAGKSGNDEPTVNLYELYINAKNPLTTDDILDFRNFGKTVDELPSLKDWKNSDFGKKMLAENTYLRTDDDIISFIRMNTPRNPIKESFIDQGGDFLRAVDTRLQEGVTPFWNQMKSAVGNNGMFDMTNPNIYKTLIPGAVGLGAASQMTGPVQADGQTWIDMSEQAKQNWEPVYKEAKKRGEVIEFGDDKDAAIKFGEGSWKSKMKHGGWLDKFQEGGVIEDDRGQWAHPGKITKINSNNITMKGVNYPVLGISDTGDRKMMQPGKDYKFKGNSVTEFPMARDGKSLVELNQLTNFTNYNTPQPGGWLDKY